MTSVDREHPPPPSTVEHPRFMRFIDYFIASFTHPHGQHAAGHTRIVCVCVCVCSRNCYESLSHPALLGLNLSLVPQVVALCAMAEEQQHVPPLPSVNSLLIPVTSSIPLSLSTSPPLFISHVLLAWQTRHIFIWVWFGLVWFGFIAALPFLAVAFPPFLACAFLPSFSLLHIHSSRSTLIFGLYLFVFISCYLSQCFLLNFGSDCRVLSFCCSLFLSPFFSLFVSFCTTSSCYVQLLCISVCLVPQVCSQPSSELISLS